MWNAQTGEEAFDLAPAFGTMQRCRYGGSSGFTWA